MTESEFTACYESTLAAIETALDNMDNEVDFDSELQENILNIEFSDHSKVIISRQLPVSQLWVAAKSGGFHFNYVAEQNCWQDEKTGEELFALLSRVCTEQAQDDFQLKPTELQ